MNKNIKRNSVIQIDPEKNQRFGGCFAFVDEANVWGVQAGVPVPRSDDTNNSNVAYVRLPWGDFEYIGDSVWSPLENEVDGDE